MSVGTGLHEAQEEPLSDDKITVPPTLAREADFRVDRSRKHAMSPSNSFRLTRVDGLGIGDVTSSESVGDS